MIFGGTFDPPHLGHLHLVRQAVETFQGAVRVVPNGYPPHKPTPVASWQQRLAMCRSLVHGLNHVEVDEEESPLSPRYTVETLAAFRRRSPATVLWLVMGSDCLSSLHRWRQWQHLFKIAHLVVVRREGHSMGVPLSLNAYLCPRIVEKKALYQGCGGVYFWSCCLPKVSASAVREAIACGKDVRCSLPPAVYRYIQQHRLYQTLR